MVNTVKDMIKKIAILIFLGWFSQLSVQSNQATTTVANDMAKTVVLNVSSEDSNKNQAWLEDDSAPCATDSNDAIWVGSDSCQVPN
jgi:hypothetical protein